MPHNPLFPSEFGLLGWLEQTRIQLPLQKVDCRFDVAGDFATVELVQVFQQNAGKSLDITYSFPLPANAAVYLCELTINGRIIKAVVMDEKQAGDLANRKKAEGRRTALVQMERDNLFTLNLGNAAPGDSIEVRFAYLQVLDRLESSLSLGIPFTPGVRYIPGNPLVRTNRGAGYADDTDQVPDASRISPPRISANHPEIAELYMEGRLTTAEVNIGTMSSPSHPVILKIAGEHLLVRFAAGADIPDRDFVLRWDEPVGEATACRAWSCASDEKTYALLQIRAPREVVATQTPQDVYFLVDRSGSMAGVKWQKCSRALEAFVKNLDEADRVWITFFESSFKDFAESPLPRDAILADSNFKIVELMKTAGGTELLPALKHVHEQVARHSKNRKARIVLITDGQVGNEEAVQRVAASRAQIPMYCFGIDTAVNDAVLRAMASRTHGRCMLMTPEDDIVGAVARLSRTLRLPVLSGIGLVGHLKDENPDACFPELCAAEVSTVAVRCGRDDARVEVAGTLANGQSWRASVDLLPDDTCQAPRLAWARGRINYLLAEDQKTEAVQIACKHNIVCKGASFVAIDEAEKVPVAQQKVYQPAFQREMMICDAPSLRRAGAHKLDLGDEAWCMADERPRGSDDFFKSVRPEIDSASHQLRGWLVTHVCLPEWIAESLSEIVRSWIFEAHTTRLGLVHAWVANKTPGLDSEYLLKLFENELTGRYRHKAVTVLKNLQALLCADNKP